MSYIRWQTTSVMKEFLATMLLSLIGCLYAEAQVDTLGVIWGPNMQDTKGDFMMGFVGELDGSVYRTSRSQGQLYLEKINHSMTVENRILLWTKGSSSNAAVYSGVCMASDKIYILYKYEGNNTIKTSFYVSTYDARDLTVDKDMISQFAIPLDGAKGYMNFSFNFDSINNKFVVQAVPYITEARNRPIYVTTLDRDLENISLKKLLPPLEIGDKILSHSRKYRGDMIFVVKKELTKSILKDRRQVKQAEYDLDILTYPFDSDDFIRVHVDQDGRFLSDPHIYSDQEGDFCLGRYSMRDEGSANGIFLMNLDTVTREIHHVRYEELDKQFIQSVMTSEERRKVERKADTGKDIELRGLCIEDVYRRRDGGLSVIAEQRIATDVESQVILANIVIIDLMKIDGIQNQSRIPKYHKPFLAIREHLSSFITTGYCASTKNDTRYFMFNNDRRNHLLMEGETLKSYWPGEKDAVVTLASVRSNGLVNMGVLFDVSKSESALIPTCSQTLSDGSLMIRICGRDGCKFGRVAFR